MIETPDRIACIRADRVGDMVCLLPALASLRAAFPQAQIDVLCSRANAGLLAHDPNVDRVHAFPFEPREQNWRLAAALLQQFRQHHYDVVLTFYSRSHTNLATGLSGARVRAGFDNKPFKFLLTHAVPNQASTHEIERNLAMVEAIGVTPVTHQPTVHVSEEERAHATTWLQANRIEGPLIALHAGATAPGRRYSPQRLAEAVRDLMPNASYIVFEGPMDEAETRQLCAQLPRTHVFKGTLLEMAALLEHCALAVMNDSGPMHVAAASGIPVVGIFGPSPMNRWAPRGITRAVQAPSHRVDDIEPREIVEAARALMANRSR